MKIIVYTPKYRDDLIFMVLAAKDALGRVPTLNGDLLDLDGAYSVSYTHLTLPTIA